ncbi:phage tailspike protein [Vibrio sp. SCSIO 43136]|uniref:phage tailspike protein n=1 Tax=Vibrio sp. SCSIO 43136 TaxID=2819101 RepID=UPI002075CC2B|nr:phage tailspike protein [Vibrio sp. SCSIO 43136]USD64202.1 hypothetical protein J4N39_08770 [Vibrio sp. SCSIO 43136]
MASNLLNPLSGQQIDPSKVTGRAQPVSNGYFWFGELDGDPVINPIKVQAKDESGTVIDVAQPVRTNASGFFVDQNGRLLELFSEKIGYSVLVRDKNQKVIYGPVKKGDVGNIASAISIYTDIVYKASQGKTAVENMVAGNPIEARVGDVVSSGITWWKRTSNSSNSIQDFTPTSAIALEDFGGNLTDPAHDDTLAFVEAAKLGGSIVIGPGTATVKPKTTAEVNLVSDTKIWGLGVGISNLLVSENQNPADSCYGLKIKNLKNITFEHLSVVSDSKEKDIFNLGRLKADGTYDRTDFGRIFAMRITGTENIVFNHVSIEGFNSQSGAVLFTNEDGEVKYNKNLKLIQCESRFNRATGFSLQAVDGYRIEGGVHEQNGLQVFDSIDSEGNPTSKVRTPTNYIDGGTGYGLVIGRLTSASKLKTKNGVILGVKTSRNVRHGIDLHSGNGVEIIGHESTDDLLSAEALQDIGPTLHDIYGDVITSSARIAHTSYSENRGYLFDDQTPGNQRKDSNPILIANIDKKIINSIVRGPTVTGWRFRQLDTNSATDTIMFVSASANETCELSGANFTANNPDFYPSKCVDLSGKQASMHDCDVRYGIRSNFNRAAFRFSSLDGNTSMIGNCISEINVFSHGTTQTAIPMFEKTQNADKPNLTGNTIKRTTQGLRGSLWFTTSQNCQWGYNGFLGGCSGNTIDGDEYASRIVGKKTFYVSSVGAGNYDGSSAQNAFNMSNLNNLLAVLNQLPICQSGLTVKFLDTKDFGSDTNLVIPEFYQEMVVNMEGIASENGLSPNKTAGLLTTGNFFIKCPLRSDIRWKYLKLKSGGIVLDKPSDVEGCAIECNNNNSGQVGVNFESVIGYCRNTDFNKGQSAILTGRGATVVSQNNGSSLTNPTNGLHANGGIIMKNGNQPSGVQLEENGGVIR